MEQIKIKFTPTWTIDYNNKPSDPKAGAVLEKGKNILNSCLILVLTPKQYNVLHNNDIKAGKNT